MIGALSPARSIRVDEHEFVDDIPERDVVAGGGADGPRRADDAHLAHSRSYLASGSG